MPALIERSADRRDSVMSRARPTLSPDLVSTPSASLAAAHALLRWCFDRSVASSSEGGPHQADAKGTRIAVVPASAWREAQQLATACGSTGPGPGSLALNRVRRIVQRGACACPALTPDVLVQRTS